MTSIMGSLLYSLALLPLIAADDVPLPCIFPFTYKQTSYTSCIKVDSPNQNLWCSTTANYDEHQQRKYCALHEYGGNSSGKVCAFPFSYKNRTFYTCTNEDDQHGRFWCSTTGSYDKDEQWSYCADTRLAANSQGPCVFPFIYEEKTYSSCTADGDVRGKLWCSLTSNYDENPKWTYCDPSDPLPCVFPFIYKEKSYSKCTRDGSSNEILWCATTPNYDMHEQWKPCALHEYGGNSGGNACVFPFTYMDRTFYTCTNEDDHRGRFWCSTTGNSDKDNQWSYCADTRLAADAQGPCVFPFIYKGKYYSSCTTDGDPTGKLWCSLTSNYDAHLKWTFCDPSEHHPCTFPFIFNNESYSACTRKGGADYILWCATTDNFDRDSKWKMCSFQEYEGSAKGQPCVFPFSYKNQTYFTCTNKDDEDHRFWCATTGSYEDSEKWSYCADTRLDANPRGPCIFPFIYKGQSYSSCTTDGESNGKLWCSLTSNYDENPQRTYCEPSEYRLCNFPFIFNNKSYSACTRDGTGNTIMWCATTDNSKRDWKWKVCAQQEYEGNSKGKPCVFPFTYKKRTFYTCTNEDDVDGRFWCATTANYDRNEEWSYCADTRLDSKPKGPCVFPFIYKGQSYSSCTTDEEHSGKLWCSLTSNYDVDPKWTFCDPSEKQAEGAGVVREVDVVI